MSISHFIFSELLSHNPKTKSYRCFGIEHRQNIRLWQVLCSLIPHMELTENMIEPVWAKFLENHPKSVRNYIDIFALNLFLTFPQLIEPYLIK